MRKTIASFDCNFICGPQHDLPRPKPTLDKAISDLESCIDIQCSDGNWSYDSYMHGMANGLICALSCLTGENPKYLSAPVDGWIEDKAKARRLSQGELTETSSDLRSNVLSLISQLRCAVIAKDDAGEEPVTLGKVYGAFKKIGITGFKTPKIGGTDNVKMCAIKRKKGYTIILRAELKGGVMTYQAMKPGNENYTYDKLTRPTKGIKKFFSALLSLKGFSEYHDKIKEYLDEDN